MSTTAHPIQKKLRELPGQRRLLLGAPAEQLALLGPWTESEPDRAAKSGMMYDWVLVYAAQQADLDRLAPVALAAAANGAVVWFAYPKLTGKLKSDLTRDRGWQALDAADWLGVTQVALDAIWSALRFKPREQIAVLTRKFDRPSTR